MSLPRDRAATVQGTSKYGVVGAGAGASSPLERSLRAQARLARKLRVVRRLAYRAAKRAAAAKQALVVPPCDLHQPDGVAPAPLRRAPARATFQLSSDDDNNATLVGVLPSTYKRSSAARRLRMWSTTRRYAYRALHHRASILSTQLGPHSWASKSGLGRLLTD